MAGVDPYTGQLSADGLWRWDGTTWRPVGDKAPPTLPAWLGWTVRHQAGWWALVWVVVVGLLTDQALRVGTFGLAVSATLIAGSAMLLIAGGLERTQSRALLVVASLFAACFTFRASPWLLWPDLVASLLLFGLAASFAVRGSLFELGATELAARTLQVSLQSIAGSAFVLRPLMSARDRLASLTPLLRGLFIALPIAALLAGLLASADPVFASFFNLNIDLGRLLLDVTFIVIGALCAAGLLRAAASVAIESVAAPGWRLGATEALVVLTVLNAVFAAFAFAQVLAATGAAADTLRSAGVTYSDYARSGFFQLLWVSGITLVLLFVFSRISSFRDRSGRFAFIALAEVAIALTLMIDVVAFRRLSLYEEAYGFTMLRLYSHVFAGWIAVVFLILAADFAGLLAPRRWFIAATITSAAVLLLGMNVLNPEAVVVALNTSHAQATHKLDAAYLGELSSDATPALLSSASQVDPPLRDEVKQVACRGPRAYAPAVAALNWADAQAAAARRENC